MKTECNQRLVLLLYKQGNLVDSGTTNFGVNVAGFVLHSAIHAARPDAKCVVHVHHNACVAVSRVIVS